MCFSAAASFSAGAALAAMGTLSLRSVNRPRQAMLAAIPLLFGVQQWIEGFVWLGITHELPQLNRWATTAYAVFAYLLWPAWLPLAVRLIEPSRGRRKLLDALLAAGAALSAWLLYLALTHGIVSQLKGRHIEYVSSSAFAVGSTLVYVLATSISPLCSTHAGVRLFGVLALLSFAASYFFYETWLISVWCFFAALLSGVVLWQVRGGAALAAPGVRR